MIPRSTKRILPLACAVLAASLVTAPPAPAASAECPAPDSRATVRFLDLDSGVANRAAAGGCTINDLVDDERRWSDQGHFVRHVREVADGLRRTGVIDGRERSALVDAAARSGIGRPGGPGPYEVIFDGTPESFAAWEHVGGRGFALTGDGSMVTTAEPAGDGLGLLHFREGRFADFSLRLQFRDDRPGEGRSNSGVFVRYPGVDPETFPECRTSEPAWVAVNCGHEIQINDSPEEPGNDPRKTGSVYGFADLDLAAARPTGKGVWNDLEIRVVGQHYTVLRNGEVVNEFDNVPGIPFPGRPDDPGTSGRQYSEGGVGVQNHDADSVIAFRNIRVRELPADAR
ncbi:uncharacterized protein DUF1080 [Saccharopolyspora erythraea NRRL 2338]|uniref:Glycosyl hydrolase n=2 Tax=Saccharopolyspora erythraea TaxID=1836 RepID=A4FDZ7_SACEN|nr:DUF1080 domain-containing protein [Saccharopolyspora erythraea]PFG96002.1 uncharacterized protein DUF1080 [Saccharopolyspora erythraea NRRL 2338]QRK92559.1 DUF1080 domain-containing protein [Saccharopolyspora erythraea]CAM02272.1 glycosyl hydrolase [Saccharopolyspora erythraea NRRL 2338]